MLQRIREELDTKALLQQIRYRFKTYIGFAFFSYPIEIISDYFELNIVKIILLKLFDTSNEKREAHFIQSVVDCLQATLLGNHNSLNYY